MKEHLPLLQTFIESFGHPPKLLVRAPGRVNLLGEHIDYNDGWVLPAALVQSVWVAASPVSMPVVALHARDLGEKVSLALAALEHKQDLEGKPLPTWARYPAGVAWALRERNLEVGGLEAVLTGDVPIGAGLSSSAAVEVAFALAWQALGGWQQSRMELARACQHAENAYVGVQCGLMDQFASLHGRGGHVLLFDCRSLEWEPIALPTGLSLVICDSGVRRTLESSTYNERRQACEQAARVLGRHLPAVRALRDVSPSEFETHAHLLPPDTRPLAEHVVRECHRVMKAVELLRAGDAAGFGALMLEGHRSLRDLYKVSSAELDALVEIASDLPGCLGARLTGAGFGGCTINLVRSEEAPAFIQSLCAAYKQRTGVEATAWVSPAGDGASFVTC